MLPVYFEEQRVGDLEESGTGLRFAYAADWRSARNAFAISLTMPLREAPYPPETATPWFANLLPEDRMLEQTAGVLGRSQGDVYGLLEHIGRETAGALSIGGPQPLEHADYRELNEPELAEIIARLPLRPLLAGEPDITMSLAGAQTKLAVALFDDKPALPLRGAASTHVLKPESERLYATVENELLCMSLARKAGLRVAPTRMGKADKRKYLLIERYDRRLQDTGRVHRAHQEDFCQALGLYPTQKYEARHGPAFADLFGAIDRHAKQPAGDRLALLDLAIFACCIGDTDRHGKNYSLVLADGGPRLAPGYDLMSALAYDGITRNIAMKIADENRAEYLERRHWERFAKTVRLSPAATVRRVEALASIVGEQVAGVAAELADGYPADPKALQLFADKIRERSERMATNSKR